MEHTPEGPGPRALVTVARAATAVEASRLSLLLGQAGVPYVTTNAVAHVLGGGTYSAAFGPVAFKVPAAWAEQAERALREAFEVWPEQVPERCPACGAATQRGQLDCPSCGLFLA